MRFTIRQLATAAFIAATAAVILVGAQTPAPNQSAQKSAATVTDPPAPAPKVAPKNAKKAKKVGNWEKNWSIQTRLGASFDTNLEHEVTDVRGFGVVPSVVAGLEMKSRSNRFRFIYSFAAARYSINTDLNRLGNYMSAAHRFTRGRWSLDTEAEISLKGTNEDRETGNQYVGTETLSFRFNKKTRVGAFVSYRVRRYQLADADRNAVNPMGGVKLTHRLASRVTLEASYRYDVNRAVSVRQNYRRATWRAVLEMQPTVRDRIQAGINFRPRRYSSRKVTTASLAEELRRDRKWTYDAVWTHDFNRRWGVEAAYQFERQTSNDPDKFYRDHRLVFSVYFNFGNGEPILP